MTFLAILCSILLVVSVCTTSGWIQTIRVRDHYKGVLVIAQRQVDALESSLRDARHFEHLEQVPLRTRCRCKHDAFEHDHSGCRIRVPVFGDCTCLANRDEVMYTPDPIRPMKRLS